MIVMTMMLFGILLSLLALTNTFCLAKVQFKTHVWDTQQAKPLVLEWAGANGAVNITLARMTTEGSSTYMQTNSIAESRWRFPSPRIRKWQ